MVSRIQPPSIKITLKTSGNNFEIVNSPTQVTFNIKEHLVQGQENSETSADKETAFTTEDEAQLLGEGLEDINAEAEELSKTAQVMLMKKCHLTILTLP